MDDQTEAINVIMGKQSNAFKEFNNGLQIAFMPSERIDSFLKDYTEFYTHSLNLSENEIIKARERSRKDGFVDKEYQPVNYSEISETGLVFFNPKSGCEIVFNVNSAFPLPNNPYFEEELSDEHMMRLLMDQSISAELVMFCIEHCTKESPFFKTIIGKNYFDDLDFLLRFWKSDQYFTKPAVTLFGTNKK